ncbi:bifunctional DNA primase/polymerase [Streptomyces sp. UNOB3_S3]|uniref:bifunctional DNA primase/polymerase n=1 Tax=Streptomyces sp. UNOB3_S3 TaxID=2871682 RepID=UPI001E39CDEF|nr:bifunctional DNA primase/polymerase [Streptomyces sp. UNOB3_S3]MCC3777795.1 bifunctional DNA primase/polymerase [Streptomyces sp. UNOB3_S3]
MSVPPHERETVHTAALKYALAAANKGLGVFPLSRTKLPAVRSPHRDEKAATRRCRGECGRIGHGVHDATTDPSAIRALFAAAPWASGYGIACGRPPHHLIGIDLDVKHDQDGITAFTDLADAHGFTIPDTVTVLTPSGGQHRWFSGPADVHMPNSVAKLAPGIDVRGTGGYLVGPGSLTTAGRYVLAPESPRLPAEPVPEQLQTLLIPAKPQSAAPSRCPAGTSGSRATALVRFVLDATPGGKEGAGRNDRLYWAACRAYETGGPDAHGIAAALVDAALHVGLPEAEARATVASAARNARRGVA